MKLRITLVHYSSSKHHPFKLDPFLPISEISRPDLSSSKTSILVMPGKIMPEETEDQTLHLPRILCLHGGGTNARIFRAQCRVLRAELRHSFRLCFAEAPFPSQPGPDVVSVYKHCGPFRRWLRSGPEHPHINAKSAARMIDRSLHAAVKEDDKQGATGEWVGLLGFSQGAKMAASLLFRQQKRAEKLGEHRTGSNFRFAVLMAGRGPIVSLDPDLIMNPALIDASQIGLSAYPDHECLEEGEHVLRLPTIHVHGQKDQGLELHRHLRDEYCEEGSRLLEWDGNHRVPIKSKDVEAVVEQIISVAIEEGVVDI
ncbi:MAG: hypothetical protein Q9177_000335 [Variospora cf. flavescens]